MRVSLSQPLYKQVRSMRLILHCRHTFNDVIDNHHHHHHHFHLAQVVVHSLPPCSQLAWTYWPLRKVPRWWWWWWSIVSLRQWQLKILWLNSLVWVVGIEVARSSISMPKDNMRLHQPLHIVHTLDLLFVSLCYEPCLSVQGQKDDQQRAGRGPAKLICHPDLCNWCSQSGRSSQSPPASAKLDNSSEFHSG